MFHSRDVKYLREDVRVNAKIFLDLCKEAGLNVLITETVRDKAYQEYCVSQGWAAKTATVPTFHSVEAGLAFDICKNVKGYEYDDAEFFKKASAIGKKIGFSWGGDWKSFVDRTHFQWDDHKKYSSSMIKAGKYPPNMPKYEVDASMKEITGATSDEKRMIKAIQTATGALANGVIGNQTMSDIAIKLNAKCFPLNVKLYGCPAIIAKDIDPFNPNSALPLDCISGSFNGGVAPCSVLIRNGEVVCWSACHYVSLDKPESVIYKLRSTGEVKIKRVKTVSDDLPLYDVVWAVGGMGLMDFYDPKAEGFTGVFSDVLRKTNHTVLGYRNGMMYGLYCPNMTASQINTLCKSKMMFDFAIMLDGGHVAAINAQNNKINTSLKQLYAIKFL